MAATSGKIAILALIEKVENLLRTKRIMMFFRCIFLFLFFLLWGFLPNAALAQSPLEALLGGSGKKLQLQTQESNTLKKLKKQLAELQKELKQIPKKERLRKEGFSKEIRRCRKRLELFRKPFKSALFRKSSQLKKKREAIREKLSQKINRIKDLRAAHELRDQNITQLRDLLQSYLSFQKNSVKWLKKQYMSKEKHTQLKQDYGRLLKRIASSKKATSDAESALKNLSEQIETNHKSLDKARTSLLGRSPVRPSLSIKKKKPLLKQSIPSSKRKASNRKGRKKKRVPKRRTPPVKSKAQLQKEQDTKRLQKREKSLNDSLRELTIELLRTEAKLLSVRRADQQLNLNIAQIQVRFYSLLVERMQEGLKTLMAKTEGGLLYLEPTQFDRPLLRTVSQKSFVLLLEAPGQVRGLFSYIYQESKDFYKRTGFLFTFLILLFFVALIRITKAAKNKCSTWLDKAKSDDAIGIFKYVRRRLSILLLECTVRLLPLTVPFLVLLSLLWVLPLYEDIQIFMLTTAGSYLMLVVLFGLFELFFSPDEEQRFLRALSDTYANRFRRIFKFFSGFAFCYLVFYQSAGILGYPFAFMHILEVFFFAVMLISVLLVFMHKDPFINIIPRDKHFGKFFLFLLKHFYPLFYATAVAVLVVYVWGYRNLARYLGRSLGLTLLILLVAYMIYQFISTASKLTLGLNKNNSRKVHLDPNLAYKVLQFIRVTISILLLLLSTSLIFKVWGVVDGFEASLKLLNHPFLHIKNTQITLISLGKFALACGLALWLASAIRKKLTEVVYPFFQLTSHTQHAINTVIGYLISFVGIFSGLQWMGVGLSVLAVFAGVVGIGVGFGIQNIANNFISGLIITFGQPIKVGDVIEVGSVTGKVKEISARSITIETVDSRVILIPNSDILTTKVINWTLGPPYVLAEVAVGVAYGSDTNLVRRTLIEVAEKHPNVLNLPKPFVRFEDFGSSSLDFTLLVPIDQPQKRFDILSDLRFEVDQVFRERNIEISFPQRDLHLNPDLETAVIDTLKQQKPERETLKTIFLEPELERKVSKNELPKLSKPPKAKDTISPRRFVRKTASQLPDGAAETLDHPIEREIPQKQVVRPKPGPPGMPLDIQIPNTVDLGEHSLETSELQEKLSKEQPTTKEKLPERAPEETPVPAMGLWGVVNQTGSGDITPSGSS